MENKLQERAKEAVRHFSLSQEPCTPCPWGSGHINDTFLVEGDSRYILQRMNGNIFAKPLEVMENIIGVTSFLKEKIRKAGGDEMRETMTVVYTRDRQPAYRDEYGDYWRMYYMIEDAVSYDQVETEQDFYESALAFGNFQQLLSDYPADTLHETIPGFHDTKARYEIFQNAVRQDVCGRAREVEKEISFYQERKETAEILGGLMAEGRLPLRVTHNDTKLNNIMMDKRTGKGICVIDLDTVMPGLAVHDFGDAIRFGASTGAEDEVDLSKISCDMHLFKLYTKGFLKGCRGSLTKMEQKMLPMGAKVMTYECGMRFLTDYLQGDTYFKIHRERQNLDRCRTQMKLVADMEAKWQEMEQIVHECQSLP